MEICDASVAEKQGGTVSEFPKGFFRDSSNNWFGYINEISMK